MAIHEIKDQLSSVITRLGETGEEVAITKHGRVVAMLIAPRPAGVILGVAVGTGQSSPDLEDLQWTAEELDAMLEGPVLPG